MGRRVIPPPRHCAATGTRSRLDHGAQRCLLREHRRRLRSGLGMPELGPSRYRRLQLGTKVGRRKRSIRLIIFGRSAFLGGGRDLRVVFVW